MKTYKITHTNNEGETVYGFTFAHSSVEAKRKFFTDNPEVQTAFIQWKVDGVWGDKVQINR